MQKIFKLIKDEFIFGGQITSFGAVSVLIAFSLALKIPVSRLFLLLTYLGVHSVYLFDRYRDMKDDDITNHERVDYLKNHRKTILIVVIGFLVATIIIFSCIKGIIIALAGSALFIAGFAYAVFFKKITKKLVGFKDFYVAISYTLLLVIYLYYKKVPIDLTAFMLLSFVFLRYLIAEAFYDLKDIKEDKQNGLRTFALIWPERKFFAFLNILNILSAIPIMVGIIYGHLPTYSSALLLLVPYFNYYSKKSQTTKNIALYSYIYCDGEYLLWFPFIYFGCRLLS